MPDNNTENQNQNGTDDTNGSDGSDANNNTSDTTTNTTTEQQASTTQNDPAKNRKLAEVTMTEAFRDLLTFNVTLPGIYRGMHTNQFLWFDLADDFYDDFYGDIAGIMSPSKLTRYASFEEGRFYISKKTWSYNLKDGVKTELELNPFPSPYSEYIKYQLEAERALDQAIIDATKGSGGTSTNSSVEVSGNDCNPSDGRESHHMGGDHRCKPPQCVAKGKTIYGNSSRQYAKDTKEWNTSSKDLVNRVAKECRYQRYADNPYGESKCPEKLWTGSRPIMANCGDSARLLKCILDVNGYKSIICHIPNHFYNAIWENGGWTVCDICAYTCWGKDAYGHANHGDVKPTGTWDNPDQNVKYVG